MHLGVHVGGCWAHYRQNKHHRWFLDESQINQYHLAGALHPSVRWWEAMEVPRRSLQFLELSEGLTLVAVVCEDLARLDEVAELLRDVGPDARGDDPARRAAARLPLDGALRRACWPTTRARPC